MIGQQKLQHSQNVYRNARTRLWLPLRRDEALCAHPGTTLGTKSMMRAQEGVSVMKKMRKIDLRSIISLTLSLLNSH